MKKNSTIICSVEYTSVVTDSKKSIKFEATLPRPDKVDPNLNQGNYKLDVQRNRILATEAMDTAIELAQSSKYTEAKDILKKAIEVIQNSTSSKDKLSVGLIEDLEGSLRKVSDRNSYMQGGYAQVKSISMQQQQQRSNYTPSMKSPSYSNTSKSKKYSEWETYKTSSPYSKSSRSSDTSYSAENLTTTTVNTNTTTTTPSTNTTTTIPSTTSNILPREIKITIETEEKNTN